MEIQTVEKEARTYVYDLMNEAREHGFGPNDKWRLSMVNETDNLRLRKEYYPAISSKIDPEDILAVFQFVKSALQQPLSKDELELNEHIIQQRELQYILAINPNRFR
jgi:hypothetical protein